LKNGNVFFPQAGLDGLQSRGYISVEAAWIVICLIKGNPSDWNFQVTGPLAKQSALPVSGGSGDKGQAAQEALARDLPQILIQLVEQVRS
jgi:hypothetical protein